MVCLIIVLDVFVQAWLDHEWLHSKATDTRAYPTVVHDCECSHKPTEYSCPWDSPSPFDACHLCQQLGLYSNYQRCRDCQDDSKHIGHPNLVPNRRLLLYATCLLEPCDSRVVEKSRARKGTAWGHMYYLDRYLPCALTVSREDAILSAN